MLEMIHLQLVPIITALVSVVKLYLPKKYSPLYSLTIGIFFSFGANVSLLGFDSWFIIFLEGIVLGLTASGLYHFPGIKWIENAVINKNNEHADKDE